MSRVLVLVMGAGILVFGLMIGVVLLLGRILPTKQLAYITGEHMGHSNLILLDFYHRVSVNLIPQAQSLAWSPDGERIAFQVEDDSGVPDLYILDVYSHHVQRLTNNSVHPSWSPDGREIAFDSNYDNASGIFVMPVDCVDSFEHCAIRLTPKDTYEYGQPAWSPDGKSIAFISTRDNLQGSTNIYLMNRDGSNLHRLTNNFASDTDPAWSPDSRQIIYTSQSMENGTTAITIINLECHANINCVRPVFGDDSVQDPAWSPDGSSIVFVINSEIYVTDAQGHYLQRLTYDEIYEFTPQWRP